jgi:hypothetical protein
MGCYVSLTRLSFRHGRDAYPKHCPPDLTVSTRGTSHSNPLANAIVATRHRTATLQFRKETLRGAGIYRTIAINTGTARSTVNNSTQTSILSRSITEASTRTSTHTRESTSTAQSTVVIHELSPFPIYVSITGSTIVCLLSMAGDRATR